MNSIGKVLNASKAANNSSCYVNIIVYSVKVVNYKYLVIRDMCASSCTHV